MKRAFSYKIGFIIIFWLLLLGKQLSAQEVYHHISNQNIYEFLDGLANQKIIEVNSAVKPYSRKLIAEKLIEAYEKKDMLKPSQIKWIEFFLREFSKDLALNDSLQKHLDLLFYHKWDDLNPYGKKRLDFICYKDTLFTFTINPILGATALNGDSGSYYHRWNGANAFGTIGKHFGFYASLRDNYENEPIAAPTYLNEYSGAAFKGSQQVERIGVEYSDMRGGLSYSWNWGAIALVKDNFEWGTNYHGATIFSGKAPSFAHIKLHLKPADWVDFNYVHGWLVSTVVDSSRSYMIDGHYREVFHDKYLAANLLTIRPYKRIFLSVGNSVVYSDIGVHPAYLNPFMFYKSVDHTYNNTKNGVGQNSQMFFELSTRMIKFLHLYSTLFVDEVYISKIKDKDDSSNFISWKAGGSISNIVPNLTLIAEYTRNNPEVYEHFMATTTFESNNYNLGHYLKHDAEEWYIGLKYNPIPRLYTRLEYSHARKGRAVPYTGGQGVRGLDHIDTLRWESQQISFKISYEWVNDAFVFVSFANSLIRGEDIALYTSPFLHGRQNILGFGVNWGF